LAWIAGQSACAVRLSSQEDNDITLGCFLDVFAKPSSEKTRILATLTACNTATTGKIAVEFGAGDPTKPNCVHYDDAKRGAILTANILANKIKTPQDASAWTNLQSFVNARDELGFKLEALAEAVHKKMPAADIMKLMMFFRQHALGAREMDNLYSGMLNIFTQEYAALRERKELEGQTSKIVTLAELVSQYCLGLEASCIVERTNIYAFYAFAFTLVDKVGSVPFDYCPSGMQVHKAKGRSGAPQRLQDKCGADLWCGHGDNPAVLTESEWCCCTGGITETGFTSKVKKTNESCYDAPLSKVKSMC